MAAPKLHIDDSGSKSGLISPSGCAIYTPETFVHSLSMRPACRAVPTSPAAPRLHSQGPSLRLQPGWVARQTRTAAAAPCRAAGEGQAPAAAAAAPPAASAGAQLASSPPAAAQVGAAADNSNNDWAAAAGAAQRGTQPHAAAEQPQGTQPQSSVGELGIPAELLPRHLAVIMDGNSRWAAARRRPAAAGYAAGVEALRSVVRCCHGWGVPCLTVSAACCALACILPGSVMVVCSGDAVGSSSLRS